MKTLYKITLAGIATLTLIGCGDTHITKSTRTVKYLVDSNQMSLYIFDKDSLNTSNCDAECQKDWPLFEGANTHSEDIKVLEGTDHLAYRKHPLYYFDDDKIPGDILGHNIKDVWHLVTAQKGSTDTQTALSDTTIIQTYLTDKDGRTLYTFDKDEENISHCYDTSPTSGEGCESTWPVFYTSNIGTLPKGLHHADFSTIDRNTTKTKKGESLKQTTYKGQPLYYFTPDNKTGGSTKGDWVKGLWDVIELSFVKN